MEDFSKEFKQIEDYINSQSFDYEEEMSKALKECPSMMDKYDLFFGLLFGTLGAALDTSEKLKTFLDEIHESSNADNPSNKNKIIDFFAKILKHKGDWMDQVPVIQDDENIVNKFVNRSAEEVKKGIWKGTMNSPHRIFWGHDIFSFDADNPFFLEIKQYGFLKGVLQAVRHLIADTCSKQGIPIPTESWWDHSDGDKRTNTLLDFCQKYSDEIFCQKQNGANNEVFNHLFSIHMQDILANGFASASVKAYCYSRNIENKEREQQIKIVALASNFVGSAVLGSIKTDKTALMETGIPQINWICLSALVKEVFGLIKESNENIHALWGKTNSLLSEGVELNDAVLEKQKNIENEILGILSHENIRSKKKNSLLGDMERRLT